MVTKLAKVEVVTVGVGWAGGIIAAELSKEGKQIVGLERGGERSTEDFISKHDELLYTQRQELMYKPSDSTVTFRANLEDTAKPVRDPSSIQIGTDVGGGGLHWGAQTHRYFPYDFEIVTLTTEKYGDDKIPEDMPLQDWGITYDEMEPYYDKFEKTMGISGERNDFEPPRENDYPTPPLKRTKAMSLFKEAAENLGFHPYSVPSGTVSEQYENPDGQTLNACQYNGYCTFYACEWGARASPVTTVVATAKTSDNFELRTNSLVTRVLYEDDKATGVLYIDSITGEEFEQPADVVVLTSFTFNNIKILLHSEIGDPYNPETKEGIIGKNFVDHNTASGSVTGFFDDNKFNLYVATGALGMVYGDFNADNFDHSDLDFIHGGQIEYRASGNNPIGSNVVPEGTKPWGKDFKKQSLNYANRTLTISGQQSSMPHDNHYVDLDPTYTDKFGDPLLRITYNYSENDKKVNAFLVEKMEETMAEMGASSTNVNPSPEQFTPGFLYQHNSGGVIMGDSPDNSAVNNYMQMWDMENLFVCGASAFPHFGATNPTLTLGALTYRASEGIVEYLDGDGGMLVQAKNKTTFA